MSLTFSVYRNFLFFCSVFSIPFWEFWSWKRSKKSRPGTMLASSIPVGLAVWLGVGHGLHGEFIGKAGGLAAEKHHQTIDNLCQKRP